MVGHGGSSAGSYLADPTSPIPSHCVSIVVTSTLRVNWLPRCTMLHATLHNGHYKLGMLHDPNTHTLPVQWANNWTGTHLHTSPCTHHCSLNITRRRRVGDLKRTPKLPPPPQKKKKLTKTSYFQGNVNPIYICGEKYWLHNYRWSKCLPVKPVSTQGTNVVGSLEVVNLGRQAFFCILFTISSIVI